MKIAWCLSGQPRKFKKAFEYTKRNLLDYHDVDVFFHAWHDPELVGKKFDAAPWVTDPGEFEEDLDKQILSLYNPKKYRFEKPIQFDYDFDYNGSGTPPNIFFSFTYSFLQANELKKAYEKENNFKYDWVVRARFDWALNERLPFENLDPTAIYIPDLDGTTSNANNLHCSDQFAFSSSKNMDLYTDLFNNIKNYWKSMGVKHLGENLLYHHLTKNNMLLKNLEYNHTFPRGGSNSSPHSLIRN